MNRPERDQAEAQRTRTFNGLSAREWTLLSRNVWNDVSSPRNRRHLAHGAVFPEKLADRLIQMYSKPGDLVLDPFAGIGSTCIAAYRSGRHSIGIELNPEFDAVARAWVGEVAQDPTELLRPTIINGDARSLEDWIAPHSVQLTVTSPPYANFISRSLADRARTHKKSKLVHENNSRVRLYSGSASDLGNLEYRPFLRECGRILRSLRAVTIGGGYAAWVVKDYRLPPERPYIPLHSDLARIGERAGWKWHDLIVWDQNEQRSLVLLGYPSRFYTNQNCSFIVIFRRP